MERRNENLTLEELSLVNALLKSENRRCLSIAIAQVAVSRQEAVNNAQETIENSRFLSEKHISVHEWQILLKVGVIAFTEDRETKHFYLQAIDMDQGLVKLDHLIKPHVIFQRRRCFMTTFETALGIICLNFVDDEEADHFSDALNAFMSRHHNTSKHMKNAINEDANVTTSDYVTVSEDISNQNSIMLSEE